MIIFYLSYSLNGFDWKDIGNEPFELSKGTGKPLKISPLADGSLLRFPAVYARYFRITAAGGAGIGSHGCVNGFEFRYGLSKVKFIAADGGFYTRPARDWTELFSSYNGWTGSDGIFIVELDGKKDPYDIPSTGAFKNTDCYSTLQFTITYSFKAKCRTCHNEDE